jgi:hypothetical protein
VQYRGRPLSILSLALDKKILVGPLTYITPPGRRVVWFDDLAIEHNRIGCK